MPAATTTRSAPVAATGDEPEAPSRRWSRLLLVLTVVALAVTLVVHVSPWVTKGFGVSYDGYNGSMWGLGARAAREDPIGNRLGGVQPQGFHYANHPPMLLWSVTATTTLGGERPSTVRAPAVLARMAALVALAFVLRDAGFSAPETAAGLALGGTSAMFLTYGAMTDTPMLALPFGLAAIGVAQRVWQGRPPPGPIAVAVGALAALAGWQALLATALAGGLALLSPAGPGRRVARLLLAGAAGGLFATLGWIVWVRGSFEKLASQAALRSGSDESWFDPQSRFLLDLYGPVLLGIVGLGLVVGLATRAAPDRGRPDNWHGPRPLLAVLAVVVVGYTLTFRQAAGVHDYWTYWGVALVAAAGATLAHAVLATRRHLPSPARPLVAGIVALAVITLAVTGATRRSDAYRATQEGLDAVPVLAAAPRAPTPDVVTLAVRDGDGAPWASWATHGNPLDPTREELAALPPDSLLFLQGRTRRDFHPTLLASAVAIRGRYMLVPVGVYLDVMDG